MQEKVVVRGQLDKDGKEAWEDIEGKSGGWVTEEGRRWKRNIRKGCRESKDGTVLKNG